MHGFKGRQNKTEDEGRMGGFIDLVSQKFYRIMGGRIAQW
jgi:hypothetical protein